MEEINDKYKQCSICSICKKEHTSNNVEANPGVKVYVCDNCVEIARHNFIWYCLACGKSYIIPKELVINMIKDIELKRAYLLCEDLLIIQGIDMCLACSPERIIEYMETQPTGMEC